MSDEMMDEEGQGGGVDTAGYALWALEDGGHQADAIVTTVIDWLIKRQDSEGFWKRSSNRPPSEASNFTATYLALRALHHPGARHGLAPRGRPADDRRHQAARCRTRVAASTPCARHGPIARPLSRHASE